MWRCAKFEGDTPQGGDGSRCDAFRSAAWTRGASCARTWQDAAPGHHEDSRRDHRKNTRSAEKGRAALAQGLDFERPCNEWKHEETVPGREPDSPRAQSLRERFRRRKMAHV